MNKNKKFVYGIIVLLSCFVCFHFIVWQFTKKVYPDSHVVGDLARMSYKFDLINERKNSNTFEKRHIHFNDYNNEKVDLITIGDSFSNGAGGGKDRYYQDYIVNKYNMNVLNIPDISNTNNYIDSLIILLNSGFFDISKPKYIILECVQRNTHLNIGFGKLDNSLRTEDNIVKKVINSKDIFNPQKDVRDNLTFINNFNYNLIKYNLKFYQKGYGRYKNYYIEKLDKNYFSSNSKDELLFFRDDIDFINFQTKENIVKLNERLNALSEILKSKNIVLYYMPAVDKYTLYRSKLVNKDKYPKSDFFEYLSNLSKNYILINTKEILLKKLNEEYTLDIYHSDDTHWSSLGREIIVDSLNFKEKD